MLKLGQSWTNLQATTALYLSRMESLMRASKTIISHQNFTFSVCPVSMKGAKFSTFFCVFEKNETIGVSVRAKLRHSEEHKESKQNHL
jgi:hypothetical protein